MPALSSVRIGSLPLERFASILDAEHYAVVAEALERAQRVLHGRVVWNINSTARGGGVAEMLVSLLAYAHGAGVDTRWEVIGGDGPFFQLTKRIHNNLHSSIGDGGVLGDDERATYERTLEASLDELTRRVGPDDIVLVHDPQPAGLIPGLKSAIGVPVIWRCHVGIDLPSEIARRAWDFLTPYVEPADAYVFSRRSFVWDTLDATRIELIAPVIDAFSAKNQELDERTVRAILAVAGLEEGGGGGAPTFTRESGSTGQVVRPATLVEGRPLRHDDPVVVQVSRWDHLKDPVGVVRGFVEHVAPATDAHLVYAGPDIDAVADDPEGAAVLAEVRRVYEQVPAPMQERIHLACLPMDDLEENAAIVNALQRRADVVVQKSIAEGFGLTVAEAMWKARPVVATRIGGIQDQIAHDENGILLDDPFDLEVYGAEVVGLLTAPDRARALGLEAQHRVRDRFLAVRSLIQYLDLMERLVE
jgi:trehalose synthase